MKPFYSIALTIMLLVSAANMNAQVLTTTLYSEDFNGASTPGWTMNAPDIGSSTSNTNKWIINNVYPGGICQGAAVIPDVPNQPAAINGYPNSKYMHITSGSFCPNYNANFLAPTSGKVLTKMNTPVVTTGYSNVSFSFWYLCKGTGLGSSAYYGLLFYSIDGGVTWIQEGTNYYAVTAWTQKTVTNPAFNNRADLRFAFQWVQNGGYGIDPPWAVDDIKVTASSCGVAITSQSSTNPCGGSNGTISLTATGSGLLTYIIGGAIADTNVSGNFINLPAGTYTIQVTNGTCTQTGTSIVLTNPASVTATNNGPLCPGDALHLTASAIAGATYSWTGPNSFTASTANPSIVNVSSADAGTYTVTVTVAGCSATTASTTLVVNACTPVMDTVWPGDASGNGIDSYYDFLAIGVAFGDVGPIRTSANISWTGQPCALWANSFTSGANHNNADCDGDGVVGFSDTTAVIANYGLTHPKTSGEQRAIGFPKLILTLDQHFVQSGDTVTVDVSLGETTLEASDIYGVAFTVAYDDQLVKTNSITMNYQNSWLGTNGSDMITVAKPSVTGGGLNVGMVRIDHNGRSNHGHIGQIKFIANQLPGADSVMPLQMYISDITTVNANGDSLALDTKGDTLVIHQDKTTGIGNVTAENASVMVYPNPASGNIFLTATKEISSYTVTNIQGQVINHVEGINSNKTSMDLTGFAKGIYIVQTKVGNQLLTNRFTVLQ